MDRPLYSVEQTHLNQKRVARVRFFLTVSVGVLLFTTGAMGQKKSEVPSIRSARHILIPFVGYQTYKGEKLSAGFSLIQRSRIFPDTTFVWSHRFEGEQDVSTPALGLSYAYRANAIWGLEAAVGAWHNRKTFRYSTMLEVFNFSQRFEMSVSHSHTAFVELLGSYQLPFSLPWLSLTLKGGGGYAWRSVTTTQGGESFQAGTFTRIDYFTDDARKFYLALIRTDATVWRGDLLLLRLSLHYTHLIPSGDSGSAFGGFGWQVALFPMWGGRVPYTQF